MSAAFSSSGRREADITDGTLSSTSSVLVWRAGLWVDCVAMILMIWVFDGLRTINKDKDVGSLMVGCMEVATLINVITSLIETGIANTTKWMANNWKGLSEDKKHYAESAVGLLRHA